MRTIVRVLLLSVLVSVLPGCISNNYTMTPVPPKLEPLPSDCYKKNTLKAPTKGEKKQKEGISEDVVLMCQNPAYWRKVEGRCICTPPPPPPSMVVVPPNGIP